MCWGEFRWHLERLGINFGELDISEDGEDPILLPYIERMVDGQCERMTFQSQNEHDPLTGIVFENVCSRLNIEPGEFGYAFKLGWPLSWPWDQDSLADD